MKARFDSYAHHEQFPKTAESHLRALIESTSDVIWSVDREYRLVTFNKAFADSVRTNWGIQIEPGMEYPGVLPVTAAGVWISLYARTLAEGPTTTTVETSDGRSFHVTLSPIFESGTVAGLSVIGKNITEQKRAEDQLRASEMRFRTLIEQAPSPVGISRNGIVLYVNKRLAKTYALSDPQDAVGKPISAFWSPGWAQMAEEWSRRHSRGEAAPSEFEGVAQRADGTRFSVHVTLARVELPDGPANVAFFTDISGRTATEAALRESEARFRSYFDLPLVGITMTSVDKGFITVNEHVCEILGYSREELMLLDWARITHPDDLKADVNQFVHLLAGEIEHYSVDKRFLRKDGQYVWTTISVGCVRKSSGAVDYICCVIQDISERKAAEDAIANAEREYRTIFEQAPEGIFRTTKEGRAISLNPAGARLLGYSSADEAVSAITDTAQFAWYDSEDRARYAAELVAHGELLGIECRLKKKDGSPLWVSLSARNVVDENGDTLYYQGFFEDISERKRLEAESASQLRELRILNGMYNALMEARDEKQLLEAYCRIIVEMGGYRMAWVGFAEETEEKVMIPVAWYGHEDGYLSAIKVTWDGGEQSLGPGGRAVLSGKIEVSEDFDADSGMKPFREEACRRGYKSSIAVPFRVTEDSMAYLAVYGSATSKWSEPERRLMDQVASALGYGMHKLRDVQVGKPAQNKLSSGRNDESSR